MNNPSQEYFQKNKYVLLNGAIDPAICNDLTQRLHRLVEEGATGKDPQCPLSDSVYGDEVLDRFLLDMAKPIGENLGMELVPIFL